MGLLAHILKPSPDKFVRMTIRQLKRVGISGEIEYDAGAFALRFENDGEPAWLNLQNIYAEICAAPATKRGAMLELFVRSFTSGPSTKQATLDEVKGRFLPRIRPNAYYGLMDLQVKLQKMDPLKYLALDFAEGIKAELVIDFDDSIQTLGQERLDEWGVDFETCMTWARENLWRISNDDFIEMTPGLYRSPWQDNHDTARVFLEDLIWQLKVQGRHVVTMPNRDLLLVGGDGDAQTLSFMLDATLKAYEHERPMVAVPYVLEGRSWRSLTLPDDHPAAITLKKLYLTQHGRDCQQQKDLLDRLFKQEQTDIFVATCMIQENEATGAWRSMAVWGENIDTLLPVVDEIAFFREGANGAELKGLAPWQRVMEVAGDLIEKTDYEPGRYRVRSWPSEAQLAEIGPKKPER